MLTNESMEPRGGGTLPQRKLVTVSSEGVRDEAGPLTAGLPSGYEPGSGTGPHYA